MARGIAEKYAQLLGEAGVRQVLAVFRERRTSGQKLQNPAGYLVALLKENASVIEGARAREQARADQQRRHDQLSRTRQQDEHRQQETIQDTLLSLPQALQAEQLLGSFQSKQLLKKGVTQLEIDTLKERLVSGQLDLESASLLITRAMYQKAATEELRTLAK